MICGWNNCYLFNVWSAFGQLEQLNGVLRVDRQLSNLDFGVRCQKAAKKAADSLWLTAQETRSGCYWSFGTRQVQILMCPSFTLSPLTGISVCSAVFRPLTRWVHDAKYCAHPVCYLSGESGLLSHSSASSLTFSSFFCGSVSLLTTTASNLKSIHECSLKKKGFSSFFLPPLFHTALICGTENARTGTKSIARTAYVAWRSQAESDYFFGHIPKLIYLPHLASINGSSSVGYWSI